jgi:hypothetical protein
METEPRFVMVDPATDQVLFVCSGANAEGHCPIAEKPPYVCQGLRLVAASGTHHDGASMVVEHTAAGQCPARRLN